MRPDWDTPDVSLIPSAPRTGYVLNLRGSGTPWPSGFYRDLAGYAHAAHDQGTLLIITANNKSCAVADFDAGNLTSTNEGSPITVVYHAPPPADRILRHLLRQETIRDGVDRLAWLDDPESVFHHLLSENAQPRVAADLAGIISKAEGAKDEDARSEFLGWKTQLAEWFDAKDDAKHDETVRRRALQISAAVLDGSPVRSIMDAYDQLIGMPRLRVPVTTGGPLGGPSAEKKLEDAEIRIRADGTAAIAEVRPRIDSALLRHLWRTRPQLVPIITEWIAEISKPEGSAAGDLPRIAEVLVQLAQTEGAGVVIDRVDQWIGHGGNYWRLATALLARTAVDPIIGAEVRVKLAGWAEAKSMQLRQQAVAEACGEFGLQLPRIALTRLRYVLENTEKSDPRRAAIEALRNLAQKGDPSITVLVFANVAKWINMGNRGKNGSAETLASMLDIYKASAREGSDGRSREFDDSAIMFANKVLSLPGDTGDQIRSLIIDGLLELASHEDAAKQATAIDIVDSWCAAAELGKLDHDSVRFIARAILTADDVWIRGNVHRIVGDRSRIRKELFDDYVAALRASGEHWTAAGRESSADLT